MTTERVSRALSIFFTSRWNATAAQHDPHDAHVSNCAGPTVTHGARVPSMPLDERSNVRVYTFLWMIDEKRSLMTRRDISMSDDGTTCTRHTAVCCH